MREAKEDLPQQATPVDDKSQATARVKWNSTRVRILIVGVVLVAIALAVSLSITLSDQETEVYSRQIGASIAGVASGDKFGAAVALSANGTILAAGAPGAGHVRILRFLNNEWQQLGQTLVGGDFGSSVALSANGQKVAVGPTHVRVFMFNDIHTRRWEQLGQDLVEELPGDFGTSVSLSEDGFTIAVGSSQYGSVHENGYAKMYRFNQSRNQWDQVGSRLAGEFFDWFGFSIDLSADGNTVAIGGPIKSHVRVFHWNESASDWTLLGADLEGSDPHDRFGRSVSLSGDGSCLAIGADQIGADFPPPGYVQVHCYVGSQWTPRGNTLFGEGDEDQFGWSVSLSSDGLVLVVGARQNDDNGKDSGQIRVFSFGDNNEWNQLDSDINGDTTDDWFGSSVSLSSDGKVVAAGAPGSPRADEDPPGHVRVYRIPS